MTKVSKSSNPYYYKDIAKSLGLYHLFGRWGLQLSEGLEKKRLRVRIVPLDGWITDTKAVAEEMETRDYEL